MKPAIIDTVRRLATYLEGELASEGIPKGTRKTVQRLLQAARQFDETESQPHPKRVPATRLRSDIPRFIAFDPRQRELLSEYELSDAQARSSLPLKNLANMANLDLDGLQNAIDAGASGPIRTAMERAQDSLASKLVDAWKQSPLTVSFDRESTALRITVSSHADEFFSLDERSAGMRMFLALRAFLAEYEHSVRPILIVDEAEMHLHYDAQADLIRMFELQDTVRQVIYTTHSIGCLPEDLGRGVRVVFPLEGTTRSSIENVWTRQGSGTRPLIHAMGASFVPVTPSRYVVVAEGPSDALLLPTLLRDATGLEHLGFQTVSGLSEASDDEIRRLSTDAPRVAYLVDGDPGGVAIASRLRTLRVPASKIAVVSGAAAALTLEDFIDPDLLAQAITDYLRAWPPNADVTFPAANLKTANRNAAIAQWCLAAGVARPSKLRLAEEVVRLLEDAPPNYSSAIDARKRKRLITLHKRIVVALGGAVT